MSRTLRGALLIGAVWAGATTGTAMAQPLVLDTDVPVTNAKNLPEGLTAKDLAVLEAMRLRVAEISITKPVDANTGLLLSENRQGGVAAVETPTGRTKSFGVDRKLLESLKGKSWVARQEDLAGLIAPNGGRSFSLLSAVQSVNPNTNPATDSPVILAPYKAAMLANGWTKTSATLPSGACSDSQRKFRSSGAESAIGRGETYKWRPTADRDRWIAASIAFQNDCLLPVPLTSSAASLLPLAKLAVLSLDNGQPFCMALHLGGDRFVTARHCFYRPATGKRIAETLNATLVVVDAPQHSGLVEPVQNEPFAAVAQFTSSHDILLIRAPTLSNAITDRPGQTDFTVAQIATAGTPALVIGYFPLADPERAIPKFPNTLGTPAPWNRALRMTRPEGIGYCRVWDASAAADGTRCIEHSCQTTGAFSGAPVFINTSGDDQHPKWSVVGINVADAEKKSPSECGAFGNGKDGLMSSNGAIAAAVPTRLYAPQIAVNHEGVTP